MLRTVKDFFLRLSVRRESRRLARVERAAHDQQGRRLPIGYGLGVRR